MRKERRRIIGGSIQTYKAKKRQVNAWYQKKRRVKKLKMLQ